MIMLHRISIITGVLFFGSISQAIFMIEPSIGYRQETLKTINLAQSETQLKMNAPTYGLKLGFASPIGISFDLAGQQTSGKVNSEPTPAEEPEFSHTVASAQVGVNAMGILKIYLGYIFSSELEIKSTSINPGFKMKGPGYQVGLMTFPFPRVGLGLQYNVHQFNEISGANYTNGSDVKNYFEKIDSQDVSATLSILF
jgi:hypothetical protein